MAPSAPSGSATVKSLNKYRRGGNLTREIKSRPCELEANTTNMCKSYIETMSSLCVDMTLFMTFRRIVTSHTVKILSHLNVSTNF